MILPEPRGDRLHQRGKAFISTCVFAGICYGVLAMGSFNVERPSRTVFREVDLASFAPPAPEIVPRPVTGPASEAIEPAVTNAPHAATSQTLDQLDLSQIFPKDLDLSVEPASSNGASRGGQADAGASDQQIEVASGGLQGLGNLDALDNIGGAPVSGARGRANRRAAAGGGDIALTTGTQGTTSPNAEPAAGGAEVVGNNVSRAATAAAANPTVKRLSLDAFGSDYENLEVQELIDWMKRNPGELPGGVRQLVRYRPAFLSSVTSFTMDGKPYELYLMCKESLYEVHIVLVDGTESTYLVDRSFQKLSTYLREGQVRRTRDQGIVAVSSQRNAASSNKSQEFYSLFLSWWETAKKSGQ